MGEEGRVNETPSSSFSMEFCRVNRFGHDRIIRPDLRKGGEERAAKLFHQSNFVFEIKNSNKANTNLFVDCLVRSKLKHYKAHLHVKQKLLSHALKE